MKSYLVYWSTRIGEFANSHDPNPEKLEAGSDEGAIAAFNKLVEKPTSGWDGRPFLLVKRTEEVLVDLTPEEARSST